MRLARARPSDRAGGRLRERRPAVGGSRTSGYFFVGGYVLALVLLGIVPAVYVFDLAFTTSHGAASTGNFVAAFHNGYVVPAFEHILEFLGIWLGTMMFFVVTLALMLHTLARRVSTVYRFLFYMPGALAGAASVIVWLLVLDPTTSPFAFLLHWFGYHELLNTISASHLPFILAIMAFWTGAGSWIVIMYGALNNIPSELIDAAEVDGASAFQTAIRIKLPLIRRWVVYMLILCFAAGTQLFVEPQVLAEASGPFGDYNWSPVQVAYQQAFRYGNFNEAAAISVILLVLGLFVAVLVVWRGKLFEVDQ